MSNYKYNILDRLYKLPHEDYTVAMKFFPERLKIHPQTWRNWIYIKSKDKKEIPTATILQIALFFECKPSELCNVSVSKEEVDRAWENFKSVQLELKFNRFSDVQD